MESRTTPEARGWTIAFRRTAKSNRFIRLPLDLTWDEAVAYSGRFMMANPGYQVWYTSNRQAELDGRVCAQDIGNILTVYRPHSHRHSRVRIVDVTEAPAGVVVP